MSQLVRYLTDHSQIYLSGTRQTGLGVAATVDFAFILREDSYCKEIWDAETDVDERTGSIEATEVNINQKTSELSMGQEKLTPDFMLWLATHLDPTVLTNATTVGDGSLTKAEFSAESDPDGPYFTAVVHDGNAFNKTDALGGPGRIKQYLDMAIDSIEVTCAKGEFATVSMAAIGTGEGVDGLFTEDVAAVDLTTGPFEIVLTKDVFSGHTTTEVDQATRITAMADHADNGEYHLKLDVLSYVHATKTLTFADPSGTNASANVRLTYMVAETESGYEWIDEGKDLVPMVETKMKAQNIRIWLNAELDGTTFARDALSSEYSGCELSSLAWSLNFNRESEACWRVLDASAKDTAQRVIRNNVEQRITVSREISDYIMAQHIDKHATFGIEVDMVGAEWDPIGDAGKRWEIKLKFPRCKVINPDQAIDAGKHQDVVELAVLATSALDETMAIWVQSLSTYND